MNPTDLARERWKSYRQAQERVEKAAAQVREEIAHQQRRVGRSSAPLARRMTSSRPRSRRTGRRGRDAIKETGKAKGRYEAALAKLEAARGNLSSAVGLFGWVTSGGAGLAEPATNRLAGTGHSFAEVLAALHADLEHLAGFDSLERDQPVRVAFERISRVLG
jgi:hypothetical protein